MELSGVGVVVERTGDEHVDGSIASFTRSLHQVFARVDASMSITITI
jgi:hypothetical protein